MYLKTRCDKGEIPSLICPRFFIKKFGMSIFYGWNVFSFWFSQIPGKSSNYTRWIIQGQVISKFLWTAKCISIGNMECCYGFHMTWRRHVIAPKLSLRIYATGFVSFRIKQHWQKKKNEKKKKWEITWKELQNNFLLLLEISLSIRGITYFSTGIIRQGYEIERLPLVVQWKFKECVSNFFPIEALWLVITLNNLSAVLSTLERISSAMAT